MTQELQQAPSHLSVADVRQAGIDPNCWYVLARSPEVTTQPLGVTLWQQPIVLFRDRAQQIHALEDRCPHRQVKLSHGVVVDDQLECAYHGWQFAPEGTCAAVPYLADRQKLPTCRIRAYPVIEQDGFIWVFPGEATLAPQVAPMTLPEWEHLNYIATVSVIDCNAHYSFLIENLMDMHHGHLHQDYQAWASAKLEDLQATEDSVEARYQAQSYYRIDKIWSISQLFFPALRRLHAEPLIVRYCYPHWASTLGDDFTIYCLFSPVGPTRTRAYLIHFTSLNAFHRLHKLPVWFRRLIKDSLFGSAQKLLDGLVRQDVVMVEEEQQAYGHQPQRKGQELNPTLASVQRLIRDRAQLD